MYPKFLNLIVLTLYFANIAAATCSEAEQASELQKCEKTFLDTMIKDSSANCTAEVNKIHDCLEKLSKKCYSQVNEKIIKQIVAIGMKQMQAFRFYCTETKLNYTWANVAPSIKSKLTSCAVSFDETANKCSKDFRSKMQDTSKDSAAIYKSYEDSSNCFKEAPTCKSRAPICTAFGLNALIMMLLCIALITQTIA